MNSLNSTKGYSKKTLKLFVPLLISGSVLFYLLFSDIISYQNFIPDIKKGWVFFSEFLTQNGPLLFLSIAILPTFILPVSPLLALVGVWACGHDEILACVMATLSLGINCSLTYWIGTVFGVKSINQILHFFRIKSIDLPKHENLNFDLWCLILRLTPGIPFVFSNLILGSLKMPFSRYLLISIPILAVTCFGYVLAANGLIKGNINNVLGGISLILVFFLIGKFLLKGRKKNAN